MLRNVIFLFLLSGSLRIVAQTKNSKDTLATVLIINYTTRDIQIAAEVAPKFGFRYVVNPTKWVDGVIVYPDSDSMRKHNAESYRQIASLHGEKWREKFDEEVSRVKKNHDELESFFEEDKYFLSMRDGLMQNFPDNRQYGFDIHKECKLNRLFIINYYFFAKENGKRIRIASMALKVNVVKRRVKMLKKRLYEPQISGNVES